MKQIAIVYGSSTGNTQNVAETIAQQLGSEEVAVLDVATLGAGDLDRYPNLILGTSTWGLGDVQDDWEGYLSVLKKSNLEGKTIALFGLGDSFSYPDTFVDGMGILYEAVKDKGCKLVGGCPAAGYSFDASRAVVDGSFVGVALDEDNESNQTNARLDAWIAELLPQFQ